MDLYVVIRKPGEVAQLVPAPEVIDLKKHFTTYVRPLKFHGRPTAVLDDLTLFVDERAASKGMPDNVRFLSEVVTGPLLACPTNEAAEDHGLCLEHVEAVAKALNHYGVGLEMKAN